MAEETQESGTSENPQQWNVAEYENALAHLERLQDQVFLREGSLFIDDR